MGLKMLTYSLLVTLYLVYLGVVAHLAGMLLWPGVMETCTKHTPSLRFAGRMKTHSHPQKTNSHHARTIHR